MNPSGLGTEIRPVGLPAQSLVELGGSRDEQRRNRSSVLGSLEFVGLDLRGAAQDVDISDLAPGAVHEPLGSLDVVEQAQVENVAWQCPDRPEWCLPVTQRVGTDGNEPHVELWDLPRGRARSNGTAGVRVDRPGAWPSHQDPVVREALDPARHVPLAHSAGGGDGGHQQHGTEHDHRPRLVLPVILDACDVVAERQHPIGDEADRSETEQ